MWGPLSPPKCVWVIYMASLSPQESPKMMVYWVWKHFLLIVLEVHQCQGLVLMKLPFLTTSCLCILSFSDVCLLYKTVSSCRQIYAWFLLCSQSALAFLGRFRSFGSLSSVIVEATHLACVPTVKIFLLPASAHACILLSLKQGLHLLVNHQYYHRMQFPCCFDGEKLDHWKS